MRSLRRSHRGASLVRWAVTVRGVRRRDAFGSRWTVNAVLGDLVVTVWADVTRGGTVWSLQSEDFIGTSGYADLDAQITEHIHRVLAHRQLVRQIDAIETRAR
jgi:hypothetical protein